MKVTINSDVAQKNGMTTQEVMLVALIKSGVNLDQTLESLVQRQVLVKDLFGNYSVTQRWADTCDNILLSSDTTVPSDSDLAPLADKLMSIMPQGRKEGTNMYYKCNRREVILKLKKFTKLYGKYSAEDIINATQRYVDGFNGDYTFMRLLKYFILKEDRRVDAEGNGYIEEVSELATMLERKSEVNVTRTFDNGELV